MASTPLRVGRGALSGIPDQLGNRMMMVHGSRALLRALNGEPEEAPSPVPLRIKRDGRNPYVPVSNRPPLAVPKVVRKIIEQTAEAFEVHPDEMWGGNKVRPLVLARAVAIRLIRDRAWESGAPKHSTTTIGRYLRRDHSTICHALEHFDDYAKQWPEVAEVYERLSAELRL